MPSKGLFCITDSMLLAGDVCAYCYSSSSARITASQKQEVEYAQQNKQFTLWPQVEKRGSVAALMKSSLTSSAPVALGVNMFSYTRDAHIKHAMCSHPQGKL